MALVNAWFIKTLYGALCQGDLWKRLKTIKTNHSSFNKDSYLLWIFLYNLPLPHRATIMQIDVKEKKTQMFDHDNPSSPTEFKSTEPGEPKLTSNHFNPKLVNPPFPTCVSSFIARWYSGELQNGSVKPGSRAVSAISTRLLPAWIQQSETQNCSGPDVFKDWPKYLLKSRALNIQDETFWHNICLRSDVTSTNSWAQGASDNPVPYEEVTHKGYASGPQLRDQWRAHHFSSQDTAVPNFKQMQFCVYIKLAQCHMTEISNWWHLRQIQTPLSVIICPLIAILWSKKWLWMRNKSWSHSGRWYKGDLRLPTHTHTLPWPSDPEVKYLEGNQDFQRILLFKNLLCWMISYHLI